MTRVRSIISRASTMLSGGRPMTRSPITSTAVPPWPNRRAGPKVRSSITPRISSWARGRTAMAWTVKPVLRAAGAAARTSVSMVSAAVRTASGVARSSRTPPTSDLWEMSGDRIFRATGPAIASASRAASSGVAATSVARVGMA